MIPFYTYIEWFFVVIFPDLKVLGRSFNVTKRFRSSRLAASHAMISETYRK